METQEQLGDSLKLRCKTEVKNMFFSSINVDYYLLGYFYVQPSFKIFFSGQSFKHFFYMDQEKRDRGGQVKTQDGKAKQNQNTNTLMCKKCKMPKL